MAKASLKTPALVMERVGIRPADLPSSELRLHDQHIHQFIVTVPHGTTIDDVLRPPYWRNHWRTLKKWSEVTVISSDGSWEAKLRVVDTGEAFARMRVLSAWQEPPLELGDFPSDWSIEFVDSGWRVRSTDNAIITQGHVLKAHAVDAAAALVRKVVG